MLTATRERFLDDYRRVRATEGRGSDNPEYYRALPFRDLTGANSAQWQIRARTWRYFSRRLLPSQPADILDLGAGNAWMSYRLTQLNHRPVALDIFTDPRDGLRAARHYPVHFPAIESEFDALPFPPSHFDLIVFNASLHYSTDYRRTLAEARRCLRPNGRLVILDSPVYKRPEHGEQMRSERRRHFERTFGFPSDALGSIEFLDEPMLAELARDLGLQWEIHRPWYGWRWFMRPWKARLLGRRPPSRFWILVARFNQ